MIKYLLLVLSAIMPRLILCEDYELKDALNSSGDNVWNLTITKEFYSKMFPNYEQNKAASFLIKNMTAHYSYYGGDIYKYYYYASQKFSDFTLSPEQQRDSLLLVSDSLYNNLPLNTICDTKMIFAPTLIRSINDSYKQWKNCPWARHLTFDEYLEWLLPYKVVECQEHEYWRDSLLAYFGSGINKRIKNDVEYNTTLNIAELVRNEAYHKLNRYGLYTRAGLPLLNVHLMTHRTFGDIPDYAQIAVLAFRAAGVPAVLDETPVGSRYTAATQWPVILTERGEELTSEWDLATFIGGSFFPDERGPKVYRNTYAIDKRRQDYMNQSKYKYPFSLCKKDVTSKYFLTSNLSVPVDRTSRKLLKEKYVYIASAVRDESNPWRVVDFGYMKGGKASFQDMGREVLYTVMGYDGKGLVEITDPFILHKDGSIESICADTLNSKNLDIWKNNAL